MPPSPLPPPPPQSQEISDFSITQSPCQLLIYSWKPRVDGMCVEGGEGRDTYKGCKQLVNPTLHNPVK